MLTDLVAQAHVGDLLREACRARLARSLRHHRRTRRQRPVLQPIPCTD